MIQDVSGHYNAPPGQLRIQATRGRRRTRSESGKAESRIIVNVIGSMVVLSLLLGVGSTFWYGLRVRIALEQIAAGETMKQEQSARNLELVNQRDWRLSSEQMEQAAARLGLFPPSAEQLR